MPTVAEGSEGEAGLTFAFLVSMEESGRWGTTWFARSVLTNHLAEGTTADSAVENLKRTIDAEIEIAAEFGQDIHEWFKTQTPCEPRYVAAWCQLAASGAGKRTTIKLRNARCELRTSIMTTRAA